MAAEEIGRTSQPAPQATEADVARLVHRDFAPGEVAAALTLLGQYGTQPWHREPQRVKRDAVIVSRGSLTALQQALDLATRDYRDVLIGEEVDPWVIGELHRYGA